MGSPLLGALNILYTKQKQQSTKILNLEPTVGIEPSYYWSTTSCVSINTLSAYIGAPSRIRTHNPRVRSAMLYPVEL